MARALLNAASRISPMYGDPFFVILRATVHSIGLRSMALRKANIASLARALRPWITKTFRGSTSACCASVIGAASHRRRYDGTLGQGRTWCARRQDTEMQTSL